MLAPQVLLARIASAERYLALLDDDYSDVWVSVRQEALAKGDLPLAFALLHERYWSDLESQTQLQGPRAFRINTIQVTRRCGAADYWGVPCQLNVIDSLVLAADHAWPYSLGGPTAVSNIRWLCSRHNAVKSADVHLYPWEDLWPVWLDGQLTRIAQLRDRPCFDS